MKTTIVTFEIDDEKDRTPEDLVEAIRVMLAENFLLRAGLSSQGIKVRKVKVTG